MFARFSRALPRSQLAGPPIRPLYRYTATGLGASMWFWIFYKAKEDGPVLLGWKHPWDH
ncbi:uncharacterized protein PODANS_2_5510 [Podospora anserina S mat+]|uniref:Podospora anserina S mat+ genomic DNA chromosome 2, supercontig 2 n=3 Tax=Podospora TaxID=5144 RepID=B2B5R1_PODAN|nr:uncharacterized protein PODANS_2_5510 [Podospora anserina S mat+]KAK4669721.1 hypothetical protein QC763_205510 [Podospora pseudopauciseta]KAK4679589.1 hypothetical protein QC764_205510 [Podospora pseudoanserina]CAP73136.1 unnamed protein product [Podospora anserina S mat+]CDP25538.1 Putative protein of unknown function [Podospora anserina S mat+]